MQGQLVLEDGTKLTGELFGFSRSVAGEVVFSTAMTGYVETLTDPSFSGQILVLTYPLIGNYGVPQPKAFQSKKVQVSGLIVTEHCLSPSHHQSQKTLSQWLKENRVPALAGIDTRALTQKIRNHGTLLGKIQESSQKIAFYDPNKDNLVAKVSAKKPQIFRSPRAKKTICVIDCGCKRAIWQALIQRGLNVMVVPWDFDPFDHPLPLPFQGILVSNGPGDPQIVTETIMIVKKALEQKIPVLGICLGNQILALAAGAKTYKLKFGHRSLNQPVQDCQTKHCYITSQNHGFAVQPDSLPTGWQQWFSNLNDQTCEGIFGQDKRFLGVQFHPEGHPGPEDTRWVFDEFVKKL